MFPWLDWLFARVFGGKEAAKSFGPKLFADPPPEWQPFPFQDGDVSSEW